MKKRVTQVPKKVFLAANISEILSNLISMKHKDLGGPTILGQWGTICQTSFNIFGSKRKLVFLYSVPTFRVRRAETDQDHT